MRLRRSSKLMFYDPLTLVIALDSKNEAIGELYMDDEISLAHEKNGAFALREFVFTDNKLICRQKLSLLSFSQQRKNHKPYHAPNTVERIEVSSRVHIRLNYILYVL